MVTASSYTPISVNLTELKSFCRVDGSADDALLTMLFSAAVEEFNSYTGYRLGATTVTVDTEGAAQYALPLGPVTAITSVTAYDDEGVSTALTLYDDYDYINTVISLDETPALIFVKTLHVEGNHAGYWIIGQVIQHVQLTDKGLVADAHR